MQDTKLILKNMHMSDEGKGYPKLNVINFIQFLVNPPIIGPYQPPFLEV